MRQSREDRLFTHEADFVQALVTLLSANPDFSDIAVDSIIGPRDGASNERLGRADILAMRHGVAGGKQALVIECKNRPLYGGEVGRALEQVGHYGALRPTSRLVLAVPGQVADADAARIRKAGVELWDAAVLGSLFRAQLGLLPPTIAAAFAGGAQTPEDGFVSEIAACEPGKRMWSIYQGLVGRVLEHCICPPLNPPLGESPDMSGANRRDFVFANFAESGFWNSLRLRYAADYIVVDAKNYVGRVKKREVLQMANYLKHFGTGLFGIIVSRKGGDAGAIQTVREQWAHYQKLILILDDTHLVAMLNASSRGDAASVIAREIQEFRLSM